MRIKDLPSEIYFNSCFEVDVDFMAWMITSIEGGGGLGVSPQNTNIF